MNILDDIRYYISLLLVVTSPGSLIAWLYIHPLVRFWRRVGARTTLAVVIVIKLLLGVIVFLVREPLLAVEFGTSPWLMVLAAPFVLLAFALGRARRVQLTGAILNGLPELGATPEAPGRLLTEGIYARIRHPRYVEVVSMMIAWAFLCNYLATYVLAVLTIVIVAVTVPLEERELRARFGAAYRDYCERVPRFVPRLWARARGARP